MSNDFCIIIISNGRPDNVITYNTLISAKTQIPIHILIDDQDKTSRQYFENFPGMVHVFNKIKLSKRVDQYDNFDNLRTTTHARNAAFDLAEKLGVRYFLVLDDDYTNFRFRIDSKINHNKRGPSVMQTLDSIFYATLEYFKSCSFASICFAQGGDFLGVESNFYRKGGPKRKAMNSFFCDTKRKFSFVSRLNEDVNTYMSLGHSGSVFLTIPFVQLEQKATQKSTGGMTDAYIDSGTYVKSFYTILCRPDCTKISLMVGNRIHHSINWQKATPMIIDPKHKK